MKRSPRILIADRNPHVRALLRREMVKEGWQILVAKNSNEIVRQILLKAPLDILILDTDLPGFAKSSLMRILKNRYPLLSVVYHVTDAKENRWTDSFYKGYVVEKSGNSAEKLKKVVKRIMLSA